MNAQVREGRKARGKKIKQIVKYYKPRVRKVFIIELIESSSLLLKGKSDLLTIEGMS